MSIDEYLKQSHIPFETLLHAPAPSATRLAQSLHMPGRRVAKSVLVRGDDRYYLAVLPATHRIDPNRLAAVLVAGELRLATEEEIELLFVDCERGALPPFGSLYGLLTVADESLVGDVEFVFEGNVRHQGVRMRFRDYEAIEAPIRARFAEPIGKGSSAEKQAG
jgi:Ala-tRNA(Pro) deacylase